MNSVVIIMVSIGVFAMGYRFFAKFLTLGVFRIDNAAPTPASFRHDAQEFVPCNRWLLLAQHTAAISGSTTLIGVGVAVTWGWAPAFMWIIIGAMVAAGTYAVGTLWVSLRYSGSSVLGMAQELVGASALIPLYALSAFLLVLLCSALTFILGQLLVAYPSIGWLCLSLLPITLFIRRALFATTTQELFLNLSPVVVIIALAFGAGRYLPIAIFEAWPADGLNLGFLRIGPELIWVTAILVAAYFSGRDPVWRTARPRGVLAGLLLLAVVSLILVGIVLSHPEITAPRINENKELPSPIVLMLLVLTSGAFAGYHALILTGPTVRQVAHQQDAPILGYGGVVVDGLLAMTMVIVVTAGFVDAEAWQGIYGSWPQHEPLVRWLNTFIQRGSEYISVLGISRQWASMLIAFTVATMTFSALETMLRSLSYLIGEGLERLEFQTNNQKIISSRLLIIVISVSVLGVSQTQVDLDYWYLISIAGQWLAPAVFILIVIALARLARSTMLVLLPPIVLCPLIAWGTVWIIWQWWQRGLWLPLVTAIVLLLLGLWAVTVTMMMALHIHRQQTSGLPIRPSGL